MPRGYSWTETEINEMKKLLRRARRDNVPLCCVATDKYNVQALQKLNRIYKKARTRTDRTALKRKRAKRAIQNGTTRKTEIAQQIGSSYKATTIMLSDGKKKNRKWPLGRKIKILNIIKKFQENNPGQNGFIYVGGRLDIKHPRLYDWNKNLKIVPTNDEMGPRVIYTLTHYTETILPVLQANNFSVDKAYVKTGISINTIRRLMREFDEASR